MKVPLLLNKMNFNSFVKSCIRPVAEMLPYYQREGDGYVHRVRSANMHYRRPEQGGAYTHTGVHFWCGSYGFIYPSGRQNRKHASATMVSEPSPGRVVCATCEARAIGSGQDGLHKINGTIVKFRPHESFIPGRAFLNHMQKIIPDEFNAEAEKARERMG